MLLFSFKKETPGKHNVLKLFITDNSISVPIRVLRGNCIDLSAQKSSSEKKVELRRLMQIFVFAFNLIYLCILKNELSVCFLG